MLSQLRTNPCPLHYPKCVKGLFQSGDVYDKLIPDIPKSTRPVVEFLLEYYPVSEATFHDELDQTIMMVGDDLRRRQGHRVPPRRELQHARRDRIVVGQRGTLI